MAYALPPWLAPVNPVPYAVQGFQQGESIAERQNRAELAIQEMTLRREQQQRLQEQANQEMAIRNQQAAEQAKQAALKWQWQQELSGRVAQGEDPMKAWEATSTKYNPAGMASYWHQKETTRMAERRAAAAEKHQQAMEAFRERQLSDTEKRLTQTEKTAEQRLKKQQEIDPIQKQIDRLESERVRINWGKYTPEEQKVGLQGEELLKIDRELDAQRKRLDAAMGKTPLPIPPPSAPAPATATATTAQAAPQAPSVTIRRKSDGRMFKYHGSRDDIPEDQFDIVD